MAAVPDRMENTGGRSDVNAIFGRSTSAGPDCEPGLPMLPDSKHGDEEAIILDHESM